jgi:hypothetical protein
MNGARLMIGMDGLLAATSLCPITYIFSVDLNWAQNRYPNSLGFGRATRAGEYVRWVCRGQRPRLQRYGNANSSIMSFAQAKAIPKSGIMSETILSETVWFLRQTIGRTLAKLKR